MEDKAQDGASDSSVDTKEKGVEFSESPKRPEGSEKDSSNSDGDNEETTQEQPRPLRRQSELRCHQQGMTGKMIISHSH